MRPKAVVGTNRCVRAGTGFIASSLRLLDDDRVAVPWKIAALVILFLLASL